MATIRNIILDFGKVLVDYDYDIFVQSIISDPQERARFVALVSSQEFMDIHDLGEMTFLELTQQKQKEYPQWHDALQQYNDRQLDIVLGEVPGMHELLLKLRAEGFKLYGLSNWSNVVYDVMEKYDIFKLLDGIVISSDVKMIKPFPEIFHYLLDKYALNVEECVFTDDKAPNIEGARAVGLKAIPFQSAAQFEAELRELINS